MRKSIYILALLSFSLVGIGQSKKFKKSLDTISVSPNEYLENYSYTDFFELSELQDEIDFTNVNQELLDACLFFSVNKLRKKYHRPILENNMDLYKLSAAYTHSNGSSSFESDKKDFQKASKAVNYFARTKSYHSGQLKTVVNTQKLMDLKGVFNYYYDKSSVKNEESDWGLVKGDSKNRLDSTKTKEYIEPLTYLDFCDQLSKQFGMKFKKDLRNKAYSEAACSVLIDSKSVFKKRIPSAKIIFVFTGKRTELIEQQEENVTIYPDI